MKQRFIIYVLFILCLCLSFYANAQLGDVKGKVREEKKERDNGSSSGGPSSGSSGSSGYYDDNSSSSSVGVQVFGNSIAYLFKGMALAQSAALEQRFEYPHTVSLEGKLVSAYSPSYDALLLSPGIQANWGIFSTEFRFLTVQDNTDILKNIGWQVVKFNLPVKNFKASFGLGFTRVLDPGISFFEYTAGIEVRMMQNKLVAAGEFRNTPKTEGDNFRQEVSLQLDYEATRIGKLRLSPMVGVMYQNYFNSIEYWYARAGVVIRFF